MSLTEVEKYEMFKEHFTYCSKSGEFTRKKDGKVMVAGKSGYVHLCKKRWKVLAHRLVWYIEKGVPPEGMLDHINRVRNDNRIGNLREACSQKNGRNTSKHGPEARGGSLTSQYKGVRYLTSKVKKNPDYRNPWQARIRKKIGGLDHSLGCYPTEIEAAMAYDKAAKEWFGEFACVNFPCLG